ncbi:hypothetical protein SELSPUOL_01794 [Selenomonas sputigena ATCC 35185]|uniref:Uncharacterized protein n=1 Tax=Selenomonas sputigena (strain ATCC 35185 / DSM 20758 / CCUG 44933 / VPI D19B-28) TaxID=546271 RepID=C9LWE0_SELS3|nr:hypothetical protein SELSPUOL_01794 [Selenomonas sputigena ATCC 35185]
MLLKPHGISSPILLHLRLTNAASSFPMASTLPSAKNRSHF